jgi:hypothetical protein
MRFLRSLALAAVVAFASPALAQNDADAAVRNLIAGVAADPALAAQQVPTWFGPVGEGRMPLYAAFITSVFAEPGFADFARERVGLINGTDTPDYLERLAQIAKQYTRRGLARLPSAEQLVYMQNSVAFAEWVANTEPDGCRLLLLGDPDDPAVQGLEVVHHATLTDDELNTVLGIGLDGLRAIINDTPPVNTFTDQEMRIAYGVYDVAVNAAVDATGNRDGIVAAARGQQATAADYCNLLTITLGEIVELEPANRDRVLQFVLNQQ